MMTARTTTTIIIKLPKSSVAVSFGIKEIPKTCQQITVGFSPNNLKGIMNQDKNTPDKFI